MMPRNIHIDSTGISMSAKTAYRAVYGLIALGIFLGGGWYFFLATAATKADIAEHNLDPSASEHPIKLHKDAHPIGIVQVVKKHENEIATVNGGMEKLKQEVVASKKIIITVKNGFHEDRAERLADQAAKKVRGADAKLERWQQVRHKAMSNLKAKPARPIRDGLEGLL
jgi:hypothetical protein